MTKRSDLLLKRNPINLQEKKETLSERLIKLQNLLTEEKSCVNPCATYIDDLNTSIEFLKERNVNA